MLSKEQSYSSLGVVMTTPLRDADGAGHNWQGVPHRDMILGMSERFNDSLMPPSDIRVDLSRDGADLACSWLVESCPESRPGYRGGFGFTTSNARRSALCFYVGLIEEKTGVPLVTDSFLGWRFTKGADVPAEMDSALARWEESVQQAPKYLDRLQCLKLTKNEVSIMLMEAGRRKLIPWRQIGKVDAAWSRSGQTGWCLVQAFWLAGATFAAWDQMGKSLMFSRLVRAGVRGLNRQSA